MKNLVTYENLRRFAYSNDHLCTGPIKGMVVQFFGSGTLDIFEQDLPEAKIYAQKGILHLIPYYNPWAWCTPNTRAFIEELMDALFAKYDLPEDLPIVYTGSSMGGMTALAFSALAKRKPVACVPNCPVCDFFTYLDNAPCNIRTVYSAWYGVEGTMEENMKSVSPLHLVDRLPAVKYFFFHGDCDDIVRKERNTEPLVEALKEKGYDVTYHIRPGVGHEMLTGEWKEKSISYICSSILGE